MLNLILVDSGDSYNDTRKGGSGQEVKVSLTELVLLVPMLTWRSLSK